MYSTTSAASPQPTLVRSRPNFPPEYRVRNTEIRAPTAPHSDVSSIVCISSSLPRPFNYCSTPVPPVVVLRPGFERRIASLVYLSIHTYARAPRTERAIVRVWNLASEETIRVHEFHSSIRIACIRNGQRDADLNGLG
jgi:hypothetical protein